MRAGGCVGGWVGGCASGLGGFVLRSGTDIRPDPGGAFNTPRRGVDVGPTRGSRPLTQPARHPDAPAPAFFPVPIDALNARELELDLYLIHAGKEPVLYRSVGSAYTQGDCGKLAEQGVSCLFVPTAQHRVFRRMITRRLGEAYEDTGLGPEERARIVRVSCAKMIEDLMRFPAIDGIAETIGEIAGRFGRWCAEDSDRFAELLDLSARDYESALHMVNVGVGCGLLWLELCGDDPERLRGVVQGGLLHDVGKSAVPEDVLQREGKLDDDAWAFIRDHPIAGGELLAGQRGVHPVALDMVRDHHERPDGCGFPRGVRAPEIGLPARVCAIVDTFDSLATARPCRDPIPPARVMASMREEAGTLFDTAAFGAWQRVVGRITERSPERCVPDRAGLDPPRLRLIVPSAPKQAIARVRGQDTLAVTRERECDLPAAVVREAGGAERGRVISIGPGRMRLELEAGRVRVGERVLVCVENRPRVEAVTRGHRLGTGGQTIVDCDIVRVERAA